MSKTKKPAAKKPRNLVTQFGTYRMVKRTAEQRDTITESTSTPGYYVHPETMSKLPKKKAGEGYKIEPISGYDDQTGKCYRVTKVNRKGTVTALKPIKPRKRIKARSDSLRARALRELYEEAKETFLAYRGSCERCGKERPLEVHHIRGRTSTLLIDRRWFSGICKECHNFIHQHVKTAKAEGYIAGAGEWDCPPKDSESARLRFMILDRINAIGERIKKRAAAKKL